MFCFLCLSFVFPGDYFRACQRCHDKTTKYKGFFDRWFSTRAYPSCAIWKRRKESDLFSSCFYRNYYFQYHHDHHFITTTITIATTITITTSINTTITITTSINTTITITTTTRISITITTTITITFTNTILIFFYLIVNTSSRQQCILKLKIAQEKCQERTPIAMPRNFSLIHTPHHHISNLSSLIYPLPKNVFSRNRLIFNSHFQ